MPRVATLRSKLSGEYRLTVRNDSGESNENREYLLEFEAKFDRLSDREQGCSDANVYELYGW
jgi:hypothetical protein